MSGIVELAYTVLLGWMRAVFDWFWSMVSGTGNSGGWQWFLSNWKMWLVLLLIGGLVVDWLTWVVRWRPYRLFLGRFRRAPARSGAQPAEDEDWDSGVGYYEPETAVDASTPEWADTTFATLSEIDPDWAGGRMISEEETPYYDPNFGTANTGYYAEQYEEPVDGSAGFAMDGPQMGYWEETPDELAEPLYDERPPMSPEDFDPFAPYDEDEPLYDEPEMVEYQAPVREEHPPVSFEEQLLAAEAEEESFIPEGMPQYGRPSIWPGAQFPFTMNQEDDVPEAPEFFEEDGLTAEEAAMELPIVEEYIAEEPAEVQQPVMEEPEPAPEPYDPLFNPDAERPVEEPQPRRRRRRRLHEIAPEVWQPEDPIPETQVAAEPEPAFRTAEPVPLPSWLEPPPEDTSYNPYARPDSASAPDPFDDRIVAYIGPDVAPEPEPEPVVREAPRPSRLVRPPDELDEDEDARGTKTSRKKKEKRGVRTVTGKPALRKGLMRLTSAQDEPISGLPPLQLTDPFLPAVLPDNVDFADEDGEEY